MKLTPLPHHCPPGAPPEATAVPVLRQALHQQVQPEPAHQHTSGAALQLRDTGKGRGREGVRGGGSEVGQARGRGWGLEAGGGLDEWLGWPSKTCTGDFSQMRGMGGFRSQDGQWRGGVLGPEVGFV